MASRQRARSAPVEGPNRRVPIFAVTAGTVPGARQACLQAGMDDFIAKPFSLSTLRRKASHWLSMGSRVPEPAERGASPKPDSAKAAPPCSHADVATRRHSASVDLSRLQELADEAGSPRIVEELSLIFVEDMERRLESLRKRPMEERGERKLLSVIHSVKGACAQLRRAAHGDARRDHRTARQARRGLVGLDLEVGELFNEFPSRAPHARRSRSSASETLVSRPTPSSANVRFA